MRLEFCENKLKTVFEVTDEKKLLLLHFSSADFCEEKIDEKAKRWFTPFEVHATGKNQDDHHGVKHTASSGSESLKYKDHKYYENEFGGKLEFFLEDEVLSVILHYQFYKNISIVRSWVTVKNISAENVGLEYVSSFSLTGIDKEGEGTPNDKLKVFIPHNGWCREVDWKEHTLSNLGYDKVTKFSTKRIAVSNTGTWSTKEYLPMGAIENRESKTALLWQIENNGSWAWEISDISDTLYLKLSGPTENENHWYKELKPDESFESVKAAVCVGSDFTDALTALTAYRRQIVRKSQADSYLPVIFNDYMNCLWADPTTEKMLPVIDKAAEMGAEYYVMDAGWYADGTWWETVGEWMPCEWRFKNGIKEVFDYIRSKGMVPGIWLEPEVMGIGCDLAKKMPDECFFMRHGKRIIDHGRYQLDFRNKQVCDFIESVFDRLVSEYGVGYIKLDYNVEGSIGTEVDSDSFGDGLLGHNRAYLAFLNKMVNKYPELIIENCSSGGMRMEYASLSLMTIESLTDQEDFRNMPAISAACATAVLPEQGAMWAYPTSKENNDETALNMVNALLCRMHLSGEIYNLTDEQEALVKEGVWCYKKIREDIKKFVPFYPNGFSTYGKDWLSVGYTADEKKYLAVWRLKSDNDEYFVPLDFEVNNVEIIYPQKNQCTITKSNDGLKLNMPSDYSAVVIKLN